MITPKRRIVCVELNRHPTHRFSYEVSRPSRWEGLTLADSAQGAGQSFTSLAWRKNLELSIPVVTKLTKPHVSDVKRSYDPVDCKERYLGSFW